MYLALLCYYASERLGLTHHRPELQRKLVRFSGRLLNFNIWYSYPQEFVPLGFAVYWLVQIWKCVVLPRCLSTLAESPTASKLPFRPTLASPSSFRCSCVSRSGYARSARCVGLRSTNSQIMQL